MEELSLTRFRRWGWANQMRPGRTKRLSPPRLVCGEERVGKLRARGCISVRGFLFECKLQEYIHVGKGHGRLMY